MVDSHIGHWKEFHFSSKQDGKLTVTVTLEVKVKAGEQLGRYYIIQVHDGRG